MNATVCIGLSVLGAWFLYLVIRIVDDVLTDRQTARLIKERDAAISGSGKGQA